MTTPGARVQPPQLREPRRAVWLRRIGGVAVTLALIMLGLGAGLWLGSPASAAPGSIHVDMGDGHFVSSTSAKLLDTSALAPGGSVTGTMKVRDTSGNDGSHRGDTIKLKSMHVNYGDSCPLPTKQRCRAASRALAEQISFKISASGRGGTGTTTLPLSSLSSRGVAIGTEMIDQGTLTVTVTASLDFDSVGNEVQYGSVRFDLALKLTGPGSGAGNGTATGGDENSPGRGGAAKNAGPPGAPEVAGVNRELPPGNAENHGDTAGAGDILVLGESKSALPNTGVSLAPMLALGGGVLLGGLGLLWAARRRSA